MRLITERHVFTLLPGKPVSRGSRTPLVVTARGIFIDVKPFGSIEDDHHLMATLGIWQICVDCQWTYTWINGSSS